MLFVSKEEIVVCWNLWGNEKKHQQINSGKVTWSAISLLCLAFSWSCCFQLKLLLSAEVVAFSWSCCIQIYDSFLKPFIPKPSVSGSVVESSPATRGARVRFPAGASWCFFHFIDIFPFFSILSPFSRYFSDLLRLMCVMDLKKIQD